jgi:hypothetical protein
MLTNLLRTVMLLSYRQARRSGARMWWVVLAVAWLVHRGTRSEAVTQTHTVRRGHHVEVHVTDPTS